MTDSKKLYLVKLRGMTHSVTGPIYGVSYVVATDPQEAYAKVKKHLENNNLGFSADRELDSVQLLAENVDYPDSLTRLYL